MLDGGPITTASPQVAMIICRQGAVFALLYDCSLTGCRQKLYS